MNIRKVLASGAVAAAVIALPGAAMAEDYVQPANENAGVLGTQLNRSTPAAPAVSGATGSSGLPVTGGDIAGLTAVGLAAVGTGTVLVRRSRRVKASS